MFYRGGSNLTYIIRIHTIPKDKKEALIQYCQLAQHQDPTFRYRQEGKYIIITNPSKDIAYRRGQLLHHKFQIFYEVEWERERHE